MSAAAAIDVRATRFVDEITRYHYTVRDGEAIKHAIVVREPDGNLKSLVNTRADYVMIDAAGVIVITKSSQGASPEIVIDVANSCVEILIAATEWAPLRAGVPAADPVCLTYHVRLTDAEARPADLQEGRIELLADPFTPQS